MPRILRRFFIGCVTSFLAVVVFTGCATDIQSLNTFAHHYYEDSPQKAHVFALKQDKKNQNLLWTMQAGISAYTADLDSALPLLEKSETLFSRFEAEGIIASSTTKAGAVLANDNAMSYRGNIYEGIFINYYKALYYMQNGKYQEARTEFNRANDRQRRAKDYYTKQIQQAQENEEKRYDENSAKKVNKKKTSSQINSLLADKYSNLNSFRAFDGFINPMVSYISGLFFLLEGDSKGLDYLKEAYGITKSQYIAKDMEHFSSRNQEHYTWILIEEGRQSHKSELKFSLPLIVDKVYHFEVALPQIHNGFSFNKTYRAKVGEASYDFDEIINTDKIIITEFEKQLKAISARAITSATIKLIGQIGLSKGFEQANQSVGMLASLAGKVYSKTTTNADLRIASVLPHTILVVRIPSTQGSVAIYADNVLLGNIQITDCNESAESQALRACSNKNNILYVRQTRKQIFGKTLFTK